MLYVRLHFHTGARLTNLILLFSSNASGCLIVYVLKQTFMCICDFELAKAGACFHPVRLLFVNMVTDVHVCVLNMSLLFSYTGGLKYKNDKSNSKNHSSHHGQREAHKTVHMISKHNSRIIYYA